jgi:hypothetical protein
LPGRIEVLGTIEQRLRGVAVRQDLIAEVERAGAAGSVEKLEEVLTALLGLRMIVPTSWA